MKLIKKMFSHFSFFQRFSRRRLPRRSEAKAGEEALIFLKLEPRYLHPPQYCYGGRVGCYGISKLPHFLLAMLCVGLAGCASQGTVAPLSNGYEEVAHPKQVSFQYRAPDGKTTPIWPSLSGVSEVIKGDVALFVGDKAYVSPDPNDPRGTKPRLFAVRSPALPLDITDEVLSQWSKKSGKDFAKAWDRFSMVSPEEKNGQLELQLEFWTQERDWPDKTTLQLDWNQVSDIMREVKEKGVVQKDLRWGTPYIEK
jgi:hypothetical protein